MKKLAISTIMLFALGGASLCGASDITYNVDLTVGTDTITGSIQTNGTIGNFSSNTDIVAWNLEVNDGTDTADLTTANSAYIYETPGGGTILSASATQLSFDFSASAGGWFYFASFGFPGAIVCFQAEADACVAGPTGIFATTNDSAGGQLADLSGLTVIGNTAPISATPEPGTITLLGSGLLGLAGVLRRKLCR